MRPRLYLAVLAAGLLAPLAVGIVVATSARADGVLAVATPDEAAKRRQGELDARFIDLAATGSESEADRIVAEIWALWLQSGDSEIDALVRRATEMMQIGASASALAILDEVVRRAPGYAEGWNKRATLLYLIGEFDRSLADCGEVLQREPRHFGALAGMGLIAIAQENFKAALAAYRRALAVNPFLKGRNEIIPALEKKVEGERL